MSDTKNEFKKLDEKWIDYLEKEIEGSLHEDLSIMLARDNEIKKELNKITKIKKIVKEQSNEMPSDDLFFKKLENKIMAEVEKAEMDSPLSIQMQKNSKQYAAAAAIVIVAGFAVWISIRSLQAPSEKQVAKIRKEAMLEVQPGASFTDTIITHEDADDFIMDAAAKELETLKPSEVKQILEETSYK